MNSLKMFTDEQFDFLAFFAGIVQNVLKRERKSNSSQVQSYDRHSYVYVVPVQHRCAMRISSTQTQTHLVYDIVCGQIWLHWENLYQLLQNRRAFVFIL